jgi:two-component system cell cycle sensor histidine kinase/response regulator CckA
MKMTRAPGDDGPETLRRRVADLEQSVLRLKEAETTLRENERVLATLMSNLPGMAYRCRNTRDWTMEFVSDGCLNLTGYLPRDLIENRTASYGDLIHPDDRERVWEEVQAGLSDNRPFRMTYRIRTRSGVEKWVWEQGRGVASSGAGPICLEGFITDLTEQKRVERLLDEQSLFFQALIDAIPIPVFYKDLEARFLGANTAYERFIGLPRAAVIGKTAHEFMPRDLADRYSAMDLQLFRDRQTQTYETTFAHADGTRHQIIFNKAPLFTPEGSLSGLVGTIFDVTAQKRAEAELKIKEETAERLARENEVLAEISRIIGSTPDIREIYDRFAEEVRRLIPSDRTVITLHHVEKNLRTITYVSGLAVPGRHEDESLPLAGSVSEEIIHSRSGLLLTGPAEDINRRFPNFLPVLSAGIRSILVVPLISEDQVIGNLQFQSLTQGAYENRDLGLAERVGHQIAGAIANAQLLADRERAFKALRVSEERARTFLEDLPIGVSRTTPGPDGRYLIANRALVRLYGFDSLEELQRKTVADGYFQPQERKRFSEALLAQGRVNGFELQVKRKDGTPLWVSVTASIGHTEQGEPHFDCIVEDISRRKRAEEEMAALQEQLRQSQKMEAVGRLAGGIAHDFNNLLTVISGNCELAQFILDPSAPARENVDEIRNAATRAAALTRQLLAFSRRQIMEFKVIDLNAVLRDLEGMLRRMIGEDIDLQLSLADDLASVKADPAQIEQVVLNLAVNARDAMPAGGRLTIETTNLVLDEQYGRSHIDVPPGPYVGLFVSDTGGGMPPEVLSQIFEPFFTTKGKGRGTGLGLSMVYGIVKQSHGSIWAYSEPGMGATFKIVLPAVDDLTGVAPDRPEPQAPPRGEESILVVEDEDGVRRLAVQYLQRQGYLVLEAHSGREALTVLRQTQSPIDLILTDVVMPEMSGREMTEVVRLMRPKIRVVYMSGYTDNAIIHHGVLDPGTPFLQKPFTLESLAGKVREVLDAPSGPDGRS